MFSIQNTVTFSKVWIQTASSVQIIRCGVLPLRNGCPLVAPCKSNMTVHRAWIMQRSLYVPYRCSLCTADCSEWSLIARGELKVYDPIHYIYFFPFGNLHFDQYVHIWVCPFSTWFIFCSRYLNSWYTCIGAKQLPIIQSCETYT